MTDTPLSESLHIVLAGSTNAGKSTLFNALLQKNDALVSPLPGTTTDPVTRRIELAGLGACSLTDTAGIDDHTKLSDLRAQKSLPRIMEADLVIFVTPSDRAISPAEESLFQRLCQRNIPILVCLSFFDRMDAAILSQKKAFFRSAEGDCQIKFAEFSNASKAMEYASKLCTIIESFNLAAQREITPLEGIVRPGSTVILVTPIDSEAPKGRLILPQAQTLRDLLDRDCKAIVVRESGLKSALEGLKSAPDLVITDSQAFGEVASILPPEQPLTSFSILFARKKGDLEYFVQSLSALEGFPKNGRVLILEACAHHKNGDDIGRVKIPAILKKKLGSGVEFSFSRNAADFLTDNKQLRPSLAITCGGCMITRRSMLAQLEVLKKEGIPVLNYGIFLAWAKGLFPRALSPICEISGLIQEGKDL